MKVCLKKYFSVLLALILIAAVFPAGALAAAYGYSVSVLGVNVNTGAETTYWKVYTESKWNTQTLTNQGASASDYNVKYDRATQTLTLKDLNAPKAGANSGNTSFISFAETKYIGEKYTLNVVIEGTNTIAKPNYTVNNGITGGKGISLNLSGTGTLNISNVLYGIATNGDDGGNLVIQSGTYNIDSTGTGLRSYSGNVTVSGGVIDIDIVNRDSNTDNYGIYAGGTDIIVKNAELDIDIQSSSPVDLFRVWNATSNRNITFESCDVLARTNSGYGHRGVVSAQPVVKGAEAYTADNYAGNGKTKWDGTTNIAYDIISFAGSGKGLSYLEIKRVVPEYLVTVSANPAEGGTVTGGGTYLEGSNVTVSATEVSNYEFINWAENGTEVSASKNYSFVVTGNRDLVANFRYNPPTYTVTYNDGVEGEEVFADVDFSGLYAGDPTPGFGSDPVRAGYKFTGWTPEVQSTVSGNMVYRATWEIEEPPIIPETGDDANVMLWLAFVGLGLTALIKFGYKPVRKEY